jgi:diadenosine tetraphosphatase ApaH/serine/threonine PP2A family protein phosphatase
MIAVISDIHANLEALTRVLSDIASQGIAEKDVICLGDIVGYGPDPAECVDHAMAWRVVLMGNHDEAATREAYGFNAPAQEALNWTREVLHPGFLSFGRKRARWEFLRNLPKTHQEGEVFLVHGSPRDPTLEYILRTDTEELTGGVPEKIRDIFTRFNRVCMVGHTHDPGVITEDSRFLSPDDFGGTFTLTPGQKFIVNVGSVGQPRDGDPRACYVVFDGATARYRRVEYDIAKTVERIRRIPQIDPRFGERLLKGR